MGSSITSELSLTCRQSMMKGYLPQTISGFLAEVSLISDASERLSKLDDYVNRLQDEMKKIDAFKRELPHCMLLLRDAIGTLKEELMKSRKLSTEPILEEFIPLKKISDDLDEKDEAPNDDDDDASSRDKMNWLSSVQLWNSDNHSTCPDMEFNNKKQTLTQDTKKRAEEANNRAKMSDLFQTSNNRTEGRAFMPFKGYTNFPVMAIRKEDRDELPGVPGLSLCTPRIKNSREDLDSLGLNSKSNCSVSGSSSAANVQSNVRIGQQQQQSARKQRRCWSPELHRRFVNALQQLGGPQVATPKQIRELMQVDGLTNDEVKSHLQKYRLHTRKVPPTTNTSSNQHAVHGGKWMSLEQHGESSKQSDSHSGSPHGPLQLVGSSRASSMTGGNSMEDEDDD